MDPRETEYGKTECNNKDCDVIEFRYIEGTDARCPSCGRYAHPDKAGS